MQGITPYHTQGLLELGGHPKDPFARLLIAQAKYETLRIVTYDAVFQNYLDDILLIRK
jgi:PIN domain nuclease of toxin-antitoxin system